MMMPRTRIMAVVTVVAMLGIGVAAGITVERTVLHRTSDTSRGGRYNSRGSQGPFGVMTEPVDTASRNRMRARIVKRITEDLTLTASQTVAVDRIFARRELQLDSLRARVGPQLDSLRDNMRVSIDSVLTAEQRVKFADARKRMDARRRAAETRDREERDQRERDASR